MKLEGPTMCKQLELVGSIAGGCSAPLSDGDGVHEGLGEEDGEKGGRCQDGKSPLGGKPRPPGWRQEHLVQLRGRWERPDLASASAGGAWERREWAVLTGQRLFTERCWHGAGCAGPAVSPLVMPDPKRGIGIDVCNTFICFPRAQKMLLINPSGFQTLPKCSLAGEV